MSNDRAAWQRTGLIAGGIVVTLTAAMFLTLPAPATEQTLGRNAAPPDHPPQLLALVDHTFDLQNDVVYWISPPEIPDIGQPITNAIELRDEILSQNPGVSGRVQVARLIPGLELLFECFPARIFSCNGGPNDTQPCAVPQECAPGGTCELAPGICAGGLSDGNGCHNPGGFCAPDFVGVCGSLEDPFGGTIFDNTAGPCCARYTDDLSWDPREGIALKISGFGPCSPTPCPPPFQFSWMGEETLPTTYSLVQATQLVAVPYDTALTTAGELFVSLQPDATLVGRIAPSTTPGGVAAYTGLPGSIDFPLETGESYFVSSQTGPTPPGLANTSLGGTVYTDAATDGDYDLGVDCPLDNREVHVMDCRGDPVVGSPTLTSVSGAYSFPNLRPGKHEIFVQSVGGDAFTPLPLTPDFLPGYSGTQDLGRTPPPESCNNLDDDCDGTVDMFFTGATCGIGECREDEFCTAGVPSCTPGAPVPESCNNLDDNCDGTVDMFFTGPICGIGQCEAQEVCNAGATSCTPGQPQTEICNGLDDDCDGAADVLRYVSP